MLATEAIGVGRSSDRGGGGDNLSKSYRVSKQPGEDMHM